MNGQGIFDCLAADLLKLGIQVLVLSIVTYGRYWDECPFCKCLLLLGSKVLLKMRFRGIGVCAYAIVLNWLSKML